MKKVLFVLLVCFITMSGNAMSFKIEGKIKGLMPGDTLSFERLVMPTFERKQAFDIIVEQQDEFTYNGSHDHIGYYAMLYKPVSGKVIRSDRMGLSMLIKDGTTRIVGTTAQIYYSQLEGGLYKNDELQQVRHLDDSLGKARGNFMRLIAEANAVKDTAKAKEYSDKFNSFHRNHGKDFQRLWTMEKEFHEKHSSSEHTILYALQRIKSTPFETTTEKYEKMNDEAKNSYFGKKLKQELDKVAALQPGHNAPNFQLIGLNGETLSLKECAGKHILIYHWGLCPGSMMIDNQVIDLYNNYKDHLMVIGLTDKIDHIKDMYEKTQPGSKLMNIELKPVLKNMLAHPWFDAEKTNGNKKLETDYAFGGLPYFVFISPDGKIIARDFHKAFYTAKEKMEAAFGK